MVPKKVQESQEQSAQVEGFLLFHLKSGERNMRRGTRGKKRKRGKRGRRGMGRREEVRSVGRLYGEMNAIFEAVEATTMINTCHNDRHRLQGAL